jgi:hypothetical protein
MAANKCIHARSTPSRALHTWTVRGIAILLFAGCGTEEAPPVAKRFPGIVDSITTIEGIKQVDYRDAKSGARYQLRASLGERGWIESAAMTNPAESVRIEWTPDTVRVDASQLDGTSQLYFVGATKGIDRIKPGTVSLHRYAHSVDQLPFLLDSATQADEILGASKLGAPLGVAHDLLTQGPSGKLPVVHADTFACDHTLDNTGGCAVEAKMKKPDNQQVFAVPGSSPTDGNKMILKAGDNDGVVRIQACPPAAYDCTKPGNAGAKKEAALVASAATTDSDWRSNEACAILRNEWDGYDLGKKFTVKGEAEIRPGAVVRPKDPPDVAKQPDGAKLYWDLYDKTNLIYHSQFVQGHTKDTTSGRTSFEIALTSDTAETNYAVGGRSLVDVAVQTCQDYETWARDDYAIKITGTKSNVLYTCSTPPP